MAKKYYAVKQGRVPGVYETWDDCKNQVDGYSGAVYKSFAALAQAKEFLGIVVENTLAVSDKKLSTNSKATAYVDGSYDDGLGLFSYGVVIFYNDSEHRFAEKFNTPKLIEMRNVAGEIKAAEKAMQFCIDASIESLDLHYDYEGIAKWCIGEWEANKEGTKAYKQFYDSIKDKLDINFVKVTAHSGDKYNDLADELAKKALKGEEVTREVLQTNEVPQTNSVFLDWDNIDNLIISVGKTEWTDFESKPIKLVGNAHRCEFVANGQIAMLDFYLKNDGSATIRTIGTNTTFSTKLKELVENKSFRNKHENATCSFIEIKEELFLKLIDYLESIEKISKLDERRVASPPHLHYKFQSKFGDKMVLNHYDTGTLLLQGNPAYVFTEALYFMSIAPDIPIEDIIAQKNDVYKTKTTISEARQKLMDRIPNAYNKLDDVILKLLSPSISLSNADIEVEEYSCYVFPALKALEALLLDLLSKKGIAINARSNLSTAFIPDGGTPGRHVLSPSSKNLIGDVTYEQCVEDIYNYFKKERHTHFHANQVLSLTTMISDKTKADAILNDVLIIFDDVGVKIL